MLRLVPYFILSLASLSNQGSARKVIGIAGMLIVHCHYACGVTEYAHLEQWFCQEP